MDNAGLRLYQVQISKDGEVLLDVDLHVPPACVTTIMGPSGSGKSTLLAYITGTLASAFQAVGSVTLNGQRIDTKPAHLRKIGILFQDDLLFPHLSVGANLSFGLAEGGDRKTRQQKVSEALSSIGLKGFENRDPSSLSGGQKARVALMRMLLSDPQALLLDEPFARLDADLRDHMRNLVFSHARARNLPVLMVTHDVQDARAAGGPIINLADQTDSSLVNNWVR